MTSLELHLPSRACRSAMASRSVLRDKVPMRQYPPFNSIVCGRTVRDCCFPQGTASFPGGGRADVEAGFENL